MQRALKRRIAALQSGERQPAEEAAFSLTFAADISRICCRARAREHRTPTSMKSTISDSISNSPRDRAAQSFMPEDPDYDPFRKLPIGGWPFTGKKTAIALACLIASLLYISVTASEEDFSRDILKPLVVAGFVIAIGVAFSFDAHKGNRQHNKRLAESIKSGERHSREQARLAARTPHEVRRDDTKAREKKMQQDAAKAREKKAQQDKELNAFLRKEKSKQPVGAFGAFIGSCAFAAFCYFAFSPMVGTIVFFFGTILSCMERSSDKAEAEAKKQTELLQEIRDAQNRR